MEKFGIFHMIQSYGMDSNTYIVTGRENLVIDPGLQSNEYIAKELKKLKLRLDDVDFVINTHCHFDHCGGNHLFPNAEFYAHGDDKTAISNGDPYITCSHFIDQKLPKMHVEELPRKFKINRHNLDVIHTPGHTSGSVCLYEKTHKTLVSGDTVFRDSIGRFDLPSGNKWELIESLARLKRKSIATVLPGHGQVGDKKSITEGLELAKIL
ncbi:MAG: MBL fold metallo-hydrolase [DPANN group archaeon]|nr:MBL fold metallo-hydrolase [DPANN group archaeon]